MSATHSLAHLPLELFEPDPSHIVKPQPRRRVCKWCLAKEDEHHIAEWEDADLCRECALILGRTLHIHHSEIIAALDGLANGIAAAMRRGA